MVTSKAVAVELLHTKVQIAAWKKQSIMTSETLPNRRGRLTSELAVHRSVHPDLRGVVVSTAVAEGGRAEYEAVKELYRKSDSAEQKIKYLTGELNESYSRFQQAMVKLLLFQKVVGVFASVQGRWKLSLNSWRAPC